MRFQSSHSGLGGRWRGPLQVPKGRRVWLVTIRGGFEMGTALTWANVLAEKKATARKMDVGCMFAIAMMKRRGCWLALILQ